MLFDVVGRRSACPTLRIEKRVRLAGVQVHIRDMPWVWVLKHGSNPEAGGVCRDYAIKDCKLEWMKQECYEITFRFYRIHKTLLTNLRSSDGGYNTPFIPIPWAWRLNNSRSK